MGPAVRAVPLRASCSVRRSGGLHFWRFLVGHLWEELRVPCINDPDIAVATAMCSDCICVVH